MRYSILTPDRLRGPYRTPEELQEDYIALLNPLVATICEHGSDAGATVVFCLDKSARPLAWLLRAFWPYIAPQRVDPDGRPKVVSRPPMRFVRIDRLEWRCDPRLPFDEGGMRPITTEQVVGLRAIFSTHGRAVLDDKRLVVVDEQSETGDTLRVARMLFERAFPRSDVVGVSWMSSRIDPVTGHRRVEKIPAWYPIDDPLSGVEDQLGRGVLNPVPFDPARPAHGPRFPLESYPFLCVPPRGADPSSARLRLEIGQMVCDFVGGRLHPLITAPRVEILGEPADRYVRRARAIRQRRD